MTSPALADGIHNATALITDIAGNVGNASVALQIEVDASNPVFSSLATANAAENQTAAYDANATDQTALTYSIGGTDAALFDINSATGVVTFKAAPNYEAAGDAGANNVYDITVTATDLT